MKKVNWFVVLGGGAVGVAAVILTLLGNPAKIVKTLTEEQMAAQIHDAEHYIETARKQLLQK